MTYVHGHSIDCAQGQGEAVYTRLAAPLPPQPQQFEFLGQTVEAACFRSFAGECLSFDMLCDRLDQAICAAVRMAGWPESCLAETAVFIGSASYAVAAREAQMRQGGTLQGAYVLHDVADALGARYGHEQIYSFATACTSAAHALMQAHNLLQSGLIERAVVVGLEGFNLLTLMHFYSMGLLSNDFRPFGGNGFILGEGIACLALSAQPPTQSGMRLLAAAANTDTRSLTDVGSDSLAAVMRQALKQAGVRAAGVRLIKAHAVGSAASDAAEHAAIAAVVGGDVPLACFKPRIGHTLGASTAVETVLLHQCLRAGRLPESVAATGVAVPLPGGVYLSHFFGFGGNNVAMVWAWQNE